MMSEVAMSWGARPRERRNFPGSSGWRMLTWPKASQTFSAARMRLAITSSSMAVLRPAMVSAPGNSCFGLQDEAYRPKRAELMGIDDHAALLDTQLRALAPEHIAIGADIFAHALIAAVAVADEVCRHCHQIALRSDDADIGNETPRARVRIFGVTFGAHQPLHPLADAHDVIGKDEQSGEMIAVRMIVRRHIIGRVLGQHLQPFLEPPFVEQRRFAVEQIFDFGARYGA